MLGDRASKEAPSTTTANLLILFGILQISIDLAKLDEAT